MPGSPHRASQSSAEQLLYSDFLTFRLDLTSALLTNRANVVSILSREISPRDNAVLTIGSLQAPTL